MLIYVNKQHVCSVNTHRGVCACMCSRRRCCQATTTIFVISNLCTHVSFANAQSPQSEHAQPHIAVFALVLLAALLVEISAAVCGCGCSCLVEFKHMASTGFHSQIHHTCCRPLSLNTHTQHPLHSHHALNFSLTECLQAVVPTSGCVAALSVVEYSKESTMSQAENQAGQEPDGYAPRKGALSDMTPPTTTRCKIFQVGSFV